MTHWQDILDATLLDIRLLDLGIAIFIFSAFFSLRKFFTRAILKTLRKIADKTHSTLDDKLIETIETPLHFIFTLTGIYFAKQSLKLEAIDGFLDNLISSLATFVIFWVLYRLVNEFSMIFSSFSSRFGKALSKDIENFIIKTLRVIIIAFAVMTILQHWGVNVSAFVASLGLGGLAFALAAKDTAANLFGSLVLFTDRPFKMGDWVQAGQEEGIVEDIGIRSTKIRTFAQALITVPNANIANAAITNWTRMGKRRIHMSLGLTYSTTTEQMETILGDIRTYLAKNPDIHPETIMIYFNEFGASSLNIFCYFFTKTTVWAEYLKVRESVNLELMHIIERNGASFAFPTQSLHIESYPENSSKGSPTPC